MRFSPGTLIGPYEIVSPLGAGGTGEVYRAVDTRSARPVAIRILEDALVRDRRVATLFERDARAIAALTHPNLVSILEFDVDAQPAFVVSELLEGHTLRQRMASRPSWQKAAAIGAEIAEGLAAAHDRGIAHRDLKPENVFLTSEGGVKILDFGVAHLKEGVGVPTQTQPGYELTADAPFGTTGYASPEQIRFEEPSAASDLFSLGIILYEMATGSNPFARDTAVETSAAILNDDPPPLKDALLDAPAGFFRLIERCLDKKPEGRWESARTLASELRDLLRDAEMERVFPGRRRRRLSAAVIAAAAALLAVAGLFLFTQTRVGGLVGNDAGSLASVAILPLVNATGDPSMDLVCRGLTDALIDRLSEVRDVRVAPRPAAFPEGGAAADAARIGRALGIGAVVTGALRMDEDRIVLQLYVAETGGDGEVWSRSFTRTRDQIPSIPGDAAQSVARRLRLSLSGAESARLARPVTVSTIAFEHYTRGRDALRLESSEGEAAAIAELEAAVAADPAFARAHAALGEAYLRASRNGGTEPMKARARESISRALAIDPLLAEGHVALGLLRLWDDWDLDAAEAEFRRAIELNRSLGAAHAHYASLLMYRGWLGPAIEEARRATALDPHSRTSSVVLAGALLNAGKIDEAADELRRLLDADPGFALAHSMMGRAHAARGDGAAACLELLEGRRFGGASPDEVSALDAACAEGGLERYRRERIAVLLREGLADDPTELARLYAGLGENESAYRFLEAAFADRTGGALEVGIDPAFAQLRADTRVRSLLRRAGLLGRQNADHRP